MSLEEIGGEESTSNGGTGSSMVKTIQSLSIHQSSKIDVVKFDGIKKLICVDTRY